MFDAPVSDAALYETECLGAAALLETELKRAGLLRGSSGGFEVDRKALTDRARFLFAARCKVEGEATRRDAELRAVSSAPRGFPPRRTQAPASGDPADALPPDCIATETASG